MSISSQLSCLFLSNFHFYFFPTFISIQTNRHEKMSLFSTYFHSFFRLKRWKKMLSSQLSILFQFSILSFSILLHRFLFFASPSFIDSILTLPFGLKNKEEEWFQTRQIHTNTFQPSFHLPVWNLLLCLIQLTIQDDVTDEERMDTFLIKGKELERERVIKK